MPERLWLRLFAIAVRFYPADYRRRFRAEMQATFLSAIGASRRSGALACGERASVEIVALLVSAAREWRQKAASDPLARARAFPDCSRMRPVGITREEWTAGLDHVG